MNYNADTEMDMDWSADQARRKKLLGSGLPDAPIRRVTATLGATMTPRSAAQGTLLAGAGSLIAGGCRPGTGSASFGEVTADRSSRPGTGAMGEATLVRPGTASAGDATLGNALSALTINLQSAEHCASVCQDILAVLSDRDRLSVHAEFVDLKGVLVILEVIRQHRGETLLAALQILDKLSRTSARKLSEAGAIDLVVRCCDKDRQAPMIIESGLRVLHGLTFDSDTKLLLLRHGVRELAEGIVESRPSAGGTEVMATVPSDRNVVAASIAWQDVYSIATRLLQRMGGASKGGLRRLP